MTAPDTTAVAALAERLPPFMEIPPDALIISRHHEWRGGSAADRGTVMCIDCRVKVMIGHWPAKNCRRKVEAAHSGYGGVVILDGKTIGRFNRVGSGHVRFRQTQKDAR